MIMRAPSIALLFAAFAGSCYGQKFGAAENLAPYIPTPEAIVVRMLEAARVKPGDVVYDLGAGDGRIVIMAAQKYGAKAVGGTAQVIVTKDQADYKQNIQTFVDQKYDVIVTVGFLIGSDTLAAAQANPTIQFFGIDQFICVAADASVASV